MQYTSLWSKVLRYVLLAIVVAAALAGVYLVFGEMPAADRAALYLEVAKSLFYLIVVLVVGAFVSSVVKSFAADRQADSVIHDFRMEFLHQLQAARQRIHRAGHILRAWGLTNRFGSLPDSMNPNRTGAYCAEMANLQEASSELERLILEIGHFPDSFSQHKELRKALSAIKGYLDEVLKEYETTWASSAGSDPIACKPLRRLLDFTDEAPDGDFVTSITQPYNKALALVRGDLLPLKKKAVGGAK